MEYIGVHRTLLYSKEVHIVLYLCIIQVYRTFAKRPKIAHSQFGGFTNRSVFKRLNRHGVPVYLGHLIKRFLFVTCLSLPIERAL